MNSLSISGKNWIYRKYNQEDLNFLKESFSFSSAFSRIDITIGAPHKWLTLCSAMRRYISFARTQRRQIWVEPVSASVHG